MADIEKKILSDSSERGDQKKQIDAKVNALDKRSTDFVAHVESLGEQKATQEVIAEIEKKEKSDLSLDDTLDQQHDDVVHPSSLKKSHVLSSSTPSIASRISSQNPDSSSEANAGREQSYTKVQSQISTLPFGLDKFFADA